MKFLLCLSLGLLLCQNSSAYVNSTSKKSDSTESVDKSEEIKIYIISLDRTPLRLKFVKDQLNKFGFKCSHFHAIDGKFCKMTDLATGQQASSQEKGHTYLIESPSDKYKEANFIYSYSEQRLTPGECGCFLSHRSVWQDVVNHGYKKAIIFEDDVEFHNNFKEKFFKVMNHIPNDVDIFFLDVGMCKPYAEKTYFVSPGFWLSGFLNTPSEYYAKLKSTRRVWGLHAYCVSAQSAQKLLKLTDKACVPVDAAIVDRAEDLNLYVSKIKLVSGNHFDSEIAKLGRKE